MQNGQFLLSARFKTETHQVDLTDSPEFPRILDTYDFAEPEPGDEQEQLSLA